VKGRVLVVEDNAANLELLCDWLESEGYAVSAATTLEEAYALFMEPLPQIILLDVQLGADDGLSLTGWLRKQPRLRAIPIIAVTAHAMVTDHERILESGCSGCVSKPIDFKALAVHLERWLTVSAKT
jgi:CheY-like chemotaxis protein